MQSLLKGVSIAYWYPYKDPGQLGEDLQRASVGYHCSNVVTQVPCNAPLSQAIYQELNNSLPCTVYSIQQLGRYNIGTYMHARHVDM